MGIHRLKHSLVFRLVEAADIPDEPGDDLAVTGSVFGVCLPHDGGNIQHDHGVCKPLCAAGGVDALGGDLVGVRGRVKIHAVDEIKAGLCGVQISFVPGRHIVFRICDDIEGLTEPVTALAQRPSVSCDGKEHPPVGIDAVSGSKINAAFGKIQIFLLLFDVIVDVGEHPACPTLHPDALVLGIDLSLTVKAVEKSAVFPVCSMLQPERHAGLQKLGFELFVNLFHILPLLNPRRKILRFLPEAL